MWERKDENTGWVRLRALAKFAKYPREMTDSTQAGDSGRK